MTVIWRSFDVAVVSPEEDNLSPLDSKSLMSVGMYHGVMQISDGLRRVTPVTKQ